MSGLPSPLTSARAAVKRASVPAHAVEGMVVPALNVPFPAPKYTCPEYALTRSRLPSLLISATIQWLPSVTGRLTPAVNVLLLLPKKI